MKILFTLTRRQFLELYVSNQLDFMREDTLNKILEWLDYGLSPKKFAIIYSDTKREYALIKG